MAEEEAASSVLGPSISVPSPLFSHILSSHPHSTHTKTSLGHRCFVKASLFCHQEAWVLDLAQGLSGEGNGTPLQYSCLENPIDGGAWWATVHGVTKSRRRLSDFTLTFHFHALEKEMATHSGILVWRIPGTAEPGGLPSMGSHRVGHD